MKIYCMYGVGAPAERSYHYQHVNDPKVCSYASLLSLGYAGSKIEALHKLTADVIGDMYHISTIYHIIYHLV